MLLRRTYPLSDRKPQIVITPGTTSGVAFLYLPGHANSGTRTIKPFLSELATRGTVATVNYPKRGFEPTEVAEMAVETLREIRAHTLVFLASSMGGLLVPSIVERIRKENGTLVKDTGLPHDMRGVAICAMAQSEDTVLPVAHIARICRPPLAIKPVYWTIDRLGAIRDRLPVEDEVRHDREDLRGHRRDLRYLHYTARRPQLEFMAGARPAPYDPGRFPWVYIRAKQVGGRAFDTHDGFVRATAAQHWRAIYPDTQIVNWRNLRHCSFVEQPRAWGEALGDAFERLNIAPA